jgi:hypothetical protein
MPATGAATDTNMKLQFARQLYDACRDRLGEAHEQTGLALKYLRSLEEKSSEMKERISFEPSPSVCVPRLSLKVSR